MVYFNECFDVNTVLKNSFKSELMAQDKTVSKEFPMLASPSLYLDIFLQIYALESSVSDGPNYGITYIRN